MKTRRIQRQFATRMHSTAHTVTRSSHRYSVPLCASAELHPDGPMNKPAWTSLHSTSILWITKFVYRCINTCVLYWESKLCKLKTNDGTKPFQIGGENANEIDIDRNRLTAANKWARVYGAQGRLPTVVPAQPVEGTVKSLLLIGRRYGEEAIALMVAGLKEEKEINQDQSGWEVR